MPQNYIKSKLDTLFYLYLQSHELPKSKLVNCHITLKNNKINRPQKYRPQDTDIIMALKNQKMGFI